MVEARALNKLRDPRRKYKLKEYVKGGVGNEEVHESQSDLLPERIWSF